MRCPCPTCSPSDEPEALPMFAVGTPLCSDELCQRTGPHYPREYGCRWSKVHVEGQTCMPTWH